MGFWMNSRLWKSVRGEVLLEIFRCDNLAYEILATPGLLKLGPRRMTGPSKV